MIPGYSGAGTAPHLGCGDRAFESHYSDQPVLIKKIQAENTAQKCGVFVFFKKKAGKRPEKFGFPESGNVIQK